MSASRRGATGLRGVLLVDKPAGLTSHDVVARVRALTGERRVGHAGTLDPMATGLLVVLVGPFTRLEPYLSCADKTYDALISFGTATDTDDAEGTVIEELPVPHEAMNPEYAERAVASMVGPSMQMPPRYSAIKVGGRTAHRVARQGGEIELAARSVVVHDATLLEVDAGSASWHVRFRVSKGTYIRALARDLGRSVGSAAHLSGLRRIASGPLKVDHAHALDSLQGSAIRSAFTDPLSAIAMPRVVAPAATVLAGKAIDAPDGLTSPDGTTLAVVDEDGMLLAVYSRQGTRLKPAAVFPCDNAAEVLR